MDTADPDDPRLRDHDGRSRYALVSRRALLARTARLSAVAVFAGVAAACGGNDDDSVFADSSTAETSETESTAESTTDSTTTDSTVTDSTATDSTTTVADTTTGESTTTAPPDAASGVTGEVVVDFTYASDASGGRVHNPYVAVWIEDADGALVDTIALWFLQEQKGLRWLNELRRWSSVDGSDATITTISSATRTAGDYSLTWDPAAAGAAAGEYHVCIESAREHGPYSLIREALTLGTETVSADLPANGELSNARVTFTAA